MKDNTTWEKHEQAERLIFHWRRGRISRRTFLRVSALLGLGPAILSIVGRGEPALAEEPKVGGTLVVGAEGEFEPLDPHLVIGSQTARVTQNHLFENLVQIDFASEESPPPFIPGLAQSWEISDDGKLYTFHLASGVKFHDGTDFNAEAVKWNIERQWDQTRLGRSNPPHYYEKAAAIADWRWAESGLQEVEVVDPLTVRFRLAHPFNPLLRLMAQGDVGSTGMISPASYEKFGNDGIGDHPVGTGMFRFKERIFGERIVMTRNDQYWDPKRRAYLDTLVWRPMPDTTGRENALRAGEIDFLFAPNPDNVPVFEQEEFTVKMGPMPHIWCIALNNASEILHNRDVRLAIQYAVDREGMAHNLLRDTALPAQSWLSRTSDAFEESDQWYPYDPDKARELVRQAGAEGAHLVFTTSTSGSGQILPVQMGEWIQRDLNAAGFDMELRTFEWVAYLNDFFDGLNDDWDLSQMSWGMTSNYWLTVFLHPDSVYNVSHVKIPELGTIIDRAHQTPDPDEARRLYRQAAQGAKEEAWWLPVVNDLAPVIMNPKVNGFAHTPDWEMGYFGNVWVTG